METTPFEEPVAKVVDWVVDTEGERLSKFREEIERDRTANSKLFTSFKEGVTAAIEARGWYLGQGLVWLGVGLGVFAVAAVVLLWLGIHGWRSAAPRWSDVVLVALGGCAAANAVALVFGATRSRALAPPDAPTARPRRSAGRRSAAT